MSQADLFKKLAASRRSQNQETESTPEVSHQPARTTPRT